MKVLDLQCGAAPAHRFEGWFASEAEFQRQLALALVTCPVCGDSDIVKRPSAPRLNLRAGLPSLPEGAARDRDAGTAGKGTIALPVGTAEPHLGAGAGGNADADETARQAAWSRTVRHVLANTEDVGQSFAAEARRMHAGDAPERAIRGTSTPAEAVELLEEGIAVLPLAIPEHLKKPAH